MVGYVYKLIKKFISVLKIFAMYKIDDSISKTWSPKVVRMSVGIYSRLKLCAA